jgi:hypothetical protein
MFPPELKFLILFILYILSKSPSVPVFYLRDPRLSESEARR